MWPDNDGAWTIYDTGSAKAQTGGGTTDMSSVLGTIGGFLGGPAGSVIGSIAGGLLGKKGDSSGKQFQRQMRMLNVQQKWQEDMMRDQYSLSVQGMRNAGLNPILSVSKGIGSMPSSSSPSSVGDPSASQASAAQAVSARTASALAATRAVAEIAQIEAQTKNIEQQTKVGVQEEALKNAQQNLTQAQSGLAGQQNIESAERTGIYGPQSDLARQHVQESKARVIQLLSSAKHADAQASHELVKAGLTAVEIQAAEEILKGQRLEGQIDDTQFGEAMRHLKRLSTSITGLGSNAKSLSGR